MFIVRVATADGVAGEEEKFLTTHHERDQETELDYRGARFYDGDIGRFLSLDPAAMDYPTLSDYAYVAGNPITYVDKDGKDFGVYIDHENKTITIKQIYYTEGSKLELEAFDIIKENYESQNGLYGFKTKKDGTYTINFKIELVDREKGLESKESGETNFLSIIDGGDLGALNIFGTKGTSTIGQIQVAEQKNPNPKEETTNHIVFHESLHTQGVSHDLMGGNGAFINEKTIGATLKYSDKVGDSMIKVKKVKTRWTLFKKVPWWKRARVKVTNDKKLKGKVVKLKTKQNDDASGK